MYELEVFEKGNDIKYQCKNSEGQILRLEFSKWYFPFSNKEQWYVMFYISDKRKHKYQFLKQTGKDGIKSLLWAKRALIDFIDKNINRDVDSQIVIYWDNGKRKRVYEYGLKALGFRMSFVENRPCLLLEIKKYAGLE